MSIARRIIAGAAVAFEIADQPRPVRPYHKTSNVVFLNTARRESFTDRARRLETAYLTGSTHRQLPIEDQFRSPQQSLRIDPMRMTFDQRESRWERNFTKNSTGIGKRNHPTEIYSPTTREMITVLRCKETVGKGRAHDSHGQHGRKPRYKDFATRRHTNE